MRKITGLDIIQKTRCREVVNARNIVIHQMYLDGFTKEAIGRMLGLTHATICHSVDSVETLLQYPATREPELLLWEKFNRSCHFDYTDTSIGDMVTICCLDNRDCEKCRRKYESSPMIVIQKESSRIHTDEVLYHLRCNHKKNVDWIITSDKICNKK